MIIYCLSSVCWVWNWCHWHNHSDQHLQERGLDYSQDIQHSAQTDLLQCCIQVRGGDQGRELIFLLFRAPTDCVQWFTGTTGTFWFLEHNLYDFQFICPFPLHSLEESTVDSALSLNVSKIQDVAGAVKSYNFAGSQLLQSQYYTNCIRTEQGYCAIQWKESSSTSPDPFGVGSTITQVESDGCDGLNGFILIPNLSQDGIQKLPIPVSTTYAYQSQVCGSNFGIEGMGTIAQPLVSKWIVISTSSAFTKW